MCGIEGPSVDPGDTHTRAEPRPVILQGPTAGYAAQSAWLRVSEQSGLLGAAAGAAATPSIGLLPCGVMLAVLDAPGQMQPGRTHQGQEQAVRVSERLLPLPGPMGLPLCSAADEQVMQRLSSPHHVPLLSLLPLPAVQLKASAGY